MTRASRFCPRGARVSFRPAESSPVCIIARDARARVIAYVTPFVSRTSSISAQRPVSHCLPRRVRAQRPAQTERPPVSLRYLVTLYHPSVAFCTSTTASCELELFIRHTGLTRPTMTRRPPTAAAPVPFLSFCSPLLSNQPGCTVAGCIWRAWLPEDQPWTPQPAPCGCSLP